MTKKSSSLLAVDPALALKACLRSSVYELGRPLFEKATIHLENGSSFTVEAPSNSAAAKFVKSVRLNGRFLTEPRFSHSELMQGGKMRFEMSEDYE